VGRSPELGEPAVRISPVVHVSTASAASKLSSGNGNASATACTAGAAPSGRWAIMTSDGSTATTRRPFGSYEPVPAPTFTTLVAPARADSSCAAIRGSGRRISA